jgi:sulfide:quinone oxidoreductase
MAEAARARSVEVMSKDHPLRVVVAGGGIAAVETLLALRGLAGDRVDLTLVSPAGELLYRPETVREPFGGPPAARYRLEAICADVDAKLLVDRMRSVDDEARRVKLEHGGWLDYDVLVIAVGAVPEAVFEYAHTFFADRWHDDVRGIAESLDTGYARRVALIAPPHAGWTLPLYEIALLLAQRAASARQRAELKLITLESSPLAAFRGAGADAVADLLDRAGIEVITGTRVTEEGPDTLRLHPGGEVLHVDRAVALPELRGPEIPGLPSDERGFVPVEHDGRVREHDTVFAIGDACDFPVKQGGLATQQADAAAATIAARAGAHVPPGRFRPTLRAKLLTGDRPLYLRANLAAGHSTGSVAATHCLWWPAEKIAGRYVAAYLAERELQPYGTIDPRLKRHVGPPPLVHSAAGDLGIELLDEDQ